MVSQNPQTWTRVQRLELRRLAVSLGRAAMALNKKWPASGEGRAVKELTEKILSRLDGHQLTGSLESAYLDLAQSAQYLDIIGSNSFFVTSLSQKISDASDSRGITFGQLVEAAVSRTREYLESNPVQARAIPADELLKAVVPDQQTGPAKFRLADGVLRLQHTSDEASPPDKLNADRARLALLEEGAWLRDNLALTNADRNLLSLVDDMNNRLSSKQDIIQLGIASISYDRAYSRYESELNNAVAARMQGFIIGLAMYVSQFSDWIRFSENAELANYNASHVRTIYKASRELVDELKKSAKNVDPEVPQTLSWMIELINDPKVAKRRAVFAVVRSIENLISIIFTSFGTALSGVPSGAKLAVTGVTAISLLVFTANMAKTISPASAQILRTSWLEKASKIVLDSLAKAD